MGGNMDLDDVPTRERRDDGVLGVASRTGEWENNASATSMAAPTAADTSTVAGMTAGAGNDVQQQLAAATAIQSQQNNPPITPATIHKNNPSNVNTS